MKYNHDTNRDGFVIYKSFYGPIEGLTDEQLGRLFRAIFQWQINGQADPDKDIQVAFGFIVNQFVIDNNKYQERCEKNQANGRLGGRPRKNQSVITETKRFSEKPNKTQQNPNEKEKDNENDNEKRKKGNKDLTMPFSDQEFIDTWNVLRDQPKWRKKSNTALQMNLNKLSGYDVRFAIELMNTAIANDWQGLIFDDTPARYEKWKQTHTDTTRQPRPITDINEIYNDRANGKQNN